MLISYTQIESNLRRTGELGYISLINQVQLENLAFKYFGIRDEYGDIIGYQCPYSGEFYYDYSNIVLEHIIPVSSKGGTVLFNCIPTSKEVNGSGEKGAKHLISWWTNSKYWNEAAPNRLEKIVNYMLEAYDLVFKEYTIEEVEGSYLDVDLDSEYLDDEDINNNRKESTKLKEQGSKNGITSYLGFLLDCINTLEKYNIDTKDIHDKLILLEQQHIFEDIERCQLFQNIIQQLVISKIGDDSKSYLTYLLNFDIKQLINSINSNNLEEIYTELDTRLKNIENILSSNNLSIIEYFKSLRDIQDIDLIYKDINMISQKDIDIFLENIKLGLDSKINIFINMLNKGNSNILKYHNNEVLEGYPNIKLSRFWDSHKDKIKQKLFNELKDEEKYNKARELIEINEISIDAEKKIPIFIDMLNKGNSKILKINNDETLEGYPDIKLVRFFNINKNKIIKKLFDDLKNDLNYDEARKNILKYLKVSSIEEYYQQETKKIEIRNNISKEERIFQNDLSSRINCFIKMLNLGNNTILNYRNDEIFEGYPNTRVGYFWYSNKNKIIEKLFEELKEDLDYDVARKTILGHLKVSSIEEYYQQETKKIEIRNNISKEEKIFQNDLSARIDCFIRMLNQGNSVILKKRNDETFEGYHHTRVGRFWQINKPKIIERLFKELKSDPRYDMARKLIEINEITINIENQIPIFIDMLNKGNSNILKQKNKENLDGYPDIKLSRFWNIYKDRIKQKLFAELKDDSTYDIARQTVLTYLKVNSYEELLEKERRSKELKELKKMKKLLGSGDEKLDIEENIGSRKRA